MKNTAVQKNPGTILVPVDYSAYSIQACRYAAKIAHKSGWKICLFHAFYSPAFDLIELTGGLHTQQQLRAEVTDKLIEEEREALNVFRKKLLQFPEFKQLKKDAITSELKAGIARDEILAYADKIKPEMVVMGTRGADKKNTSILGSITEHALKKMKVPVLAIPEDYKFIGEENLRKIVYLTDYDESDFVSIKKLMRFTNLFPMTIHCIHIGAKNDQWESIKMQGLKEYFQKVYNQESVECEVLSEKTDLLEAVDQYVKEHKINLIALTHMQRNILEKIFKPSLAKKFFYHTEIPLLVFHG